MATVKIKSIKCQYVLSNKDYNWIVEHLGQDLQILSLNYTHSGEIWSIAVYSGDDCISLFTHENRIQYEVNYNGNRNY